MADASPPLDRLVTHARDAHVVVVGGGIGGLVAALECAKVGIRVTVLEASDRLGGVIRSARVGGVTVDLAAEGWSARSGGAHALAGELGLADRLVAAEPVDTWICLLYTSDAADE